MRRFLGCCSSLVVAACGGGDEPKEPPDTQIDSSPSDLTNQKHVEITFSALGNANTFFCSLDNAAPAQCLSPFSADVVADGPHTFSVAAALNTNVDETPATRMWTVDTVAPTTTLLTAPPVLDNTLAPVVTFEGSDNLAVVGFECALDDAAFTQCASPTTITATEGARTFKIRARDGAGNVDATPATVAWTIDLSAPDTAINAGPTAGSTSGPIGNFTFTATDTAATFECAFDDGAFEACTVPVRFELADGPHTFSVRAKDAGGLVDPSPAIRAWTVDAIAPPIALTTTPVDPTNDATPSFAFSSTEVGATFVCAFDAATPQPCTSPFDGAALADGTHTFEVRAVDAVGNASPSSFSWTIDTAAPTVTITSAPPALVAVADVSVEFTTAGAPTAVECALDAAAFAACTSPFAATGLADAPHTIAIRASDAAGNATTATAAFTVDTTPPTVAITTAPTLTNDNTPTFAFTVANATIVTCAVDAGAFAACASPATTTALADGAHTFTVRATDTVGNAATATAPFTVDTAPPTIAITTAPPNTTNDTTPSVVFTAGNGAVATDCRVDGGTFAPCTSPFTSAALADGLHSITVRATDAATNTATAAASFTVDTVAPTVAITDAPPPLSNDNTPAVAFLVTGNPSVTDCSVDGGVFSPCGSPFAPGKLNDGNHSITVRVTDGASNTSSATASFAIDATAPTVTFTSQPPALTNDATPTVGFATGGAPTAIECRVDTGAFAACASPFTAATLPDGDHSITVRVTDAAANVATRTAAFTIDATPPTVTITSSPPPASSDTSPTITFTAVGATVVACAVDNAQFVTCTSPFTTPTLVDGTHVVAVRATDAAGNLATATTPSFEIDTIPPTVSIATQPPAATNDNTATVVFTTSGSPTSVECSVDAGTFNACTSPFTTAVLLDGAHAVTIRVTDAAANTRSATTTPFTVDTVAPTVSIDTEPPALSNDKTPSVTFTTGGAPTSTQCRVDAGTFANCASPFTAATQADGNHTIAVRVTDAATNTTTATTASFAIDSVAPTIAITSQPPAITNDATPSIAFTAGADAATIECRADAGTFTACTSPFTSATLGDGVHTLSVRVTDAASNAATATSALFTIDTAPPTVTIDSQPPPNGTSSSVTVAFTVTGSPASVTCAVDGGTPAPCTSPFDVTLDDGSHTIDVTATDAANNSATASTNSFTIDTDPPTVAILGGPVGPTGDSEPSISFEATGADIVECQVDGGTFDACSTPFDPGTLDAGTHTIVVRVKDNAGNTASASRSFEVDPMAMCLAGDPERGDADVSSVVESLTAATVETWFRSSQASGDFQLWDFSPPGMFPNGPGVTFAHIGTEFVVGVDGRHNVTNSGALNERNFSDAGLDLTAWHHYAVVFTGTQTRLFVDGQELTGTQSNGSQATSFDHALKDVDTVLQPVNLAIGYFARDSIRFAQGAFLDFRVSSTARFTGAFTPQYPAARDAQTLLLFPFDEGSGADSFDLAKTLTWTNPGGWGQCFGLGGGNQ